MLPAEYYAYSPRRAGQHTAYEVALRVSRQTACSQESLLWPALALIRQGRTAAVAEQILLAQVEVWERFNVWPEFSWFE